MITDSEKNNIIFVFMCQSLYQVKLMKVWELLFFVLKLELFFGRFSCTTLINNNVRG